MAERKKKEGKQDSGLGAVRILLILCLAAAIVLLLSAGVFGTGRSYASEDTVPDEMESEEQSVRVGLSIAEGNNSWTESVYEDFQEAAQKAGMELVYHELTTFTRVAQYEDALSILEEGIDYLVLFPESERSASAIAVAAASYDVPVILVGERSEVNSLYAAVITIDYEEEGRLCAQALAEAFVDRECIILVIEGPSESSVAQAREKGFQEEVEKNEKMQILKVVEGGFSLSEGQTVMSEVIRDNPKGMFNAVFACGDLDGLGALHVAKLAGYEPGEDLTFVSIGGDQDAIKAVVAREYLATVSSGVYLGNIAINLVVRLEGGEELSWNITIPSQVLDNNSTWSELSRAMYTLY
ncbi:MAG: substrate-binding domain-containing protein [Lachnospiraceae bacterium]|nr:substrate-binding domain-containing protein [Lachnospiraceae bacterium]